MRELWLLPYLALPLAAACGDDSVVCPAESAGPLIEVEPNGLTIDSVVASAEDGLSGRCEARAHGGAGGLKRFQCDDLGGEMYRVQVRSGPHLWTKSIALGASECSAANRTKLRFDLDPATADEFENVPCTDILLFPIQVKIEPHELTVDSVTSRNGDKETLDCRPGFRSRTMFSCVEQGEGTYTVQVTSGVYTWTQSVYLHANECHVINRAELIFDLDHDTAD